LLQGGLHGDEVNGIELLRRMIAEDKVAPTRGAVLVVPLLNVFGFLNFSRDLPDGKDVNRSFPGSKGGSLASRVAATVMRKVMPHVDVAIDFHTGGGRRFNHPQIRYTASLDQSKHLADVFAAPYRFASGLIPKSFRAAAAKQNKAVIVYEGGESLRFDEGAIAHGIAGARRVMADLGLIPDAPPAQETVHLDATKWLRSPRAGLFRSLVTTGDQVEAGQILGSVSAPTGGKSKSLKARMAGHIISLNHLPVVNRGDALVRIGAAKP
jgi:uncharacterized protein